MIPKTIHYCWFGGNPKPKLAEKCIKSWKKYCPDYELVEWNENTFDIESSPLYVRQAYEAKKWAFITDYVRLWAMYNYGGIYMDTDVEVVKPLERFLSEKAFSGFESEKSVPTGIMASEKRHPLIEKLLDYYSERPFIVNGEPDCTTNTNIITNTFSEYGLQLNNKYQVIGEFTLYPKDYFCPKDWYTGLINITENTYTIHHFNASWRSIEENKDYYAIHKKYEKERKVKKLLHFRKRVLRRIFGEEFYSKHLKWKGKI